MLFSAFIGIGSTRGNATVVSVSPPGKTKFVDVCSFGCYSKPSSAFKMKVKNAVPVVIKIKINTELTEPFNLHMIKAFNAISLLEKKF